MSSIRLRQICLMFVASVAVTSAVVRAEEPDARESLETAIPDSIRLLEAKEYKAFIKKYADPEIFKNSIQDVSLDEFANWFGENKAQKLIKCLKATKGVVPTFENDGKKATFLLKEEIDGSKSISFRKIDKYWYLKN